MSKLKDCLDKIKVKRADFEADQNFLLETEQSFLEQGASPIEAAREALKQYHKMLFEENNQIREQIGLPVIQYTEPGTTGNLAEVEGKYNNIIAENEAKRQELQARAEEIQNTPAPNRVNQPQQEEIGTTTIDDLINAINEMQSPEVENVLNLGKALQVSWSKKLPGLKVVTTDYNIAIDDMVANGDVTVDEGERYKTYPGFYDPTSKTVYLNPSRIGYDTPIHEFGHVWYQIAEQVAPELIEKGKELVAGTEYHQAVMNSPEYAALSPDKQLEEALITAIGNRGADFISEEKKKSFTSWLSSLFNSILSVKAPGKIDLSKLTFQEYIDLAAKDILSGGELLLNRVSAGAVATTAYEDSGVKMLRTKTDSPIDLIEDAGLRRKMTEDGLGNYLFFHYADKDLTKSGIDPKFHGKSYLKTSAEERAMKPDVSYYYTSTWREPFVGDYGHVVAVPKDKVYPFNSDPLNLYDEAKELFQQDWPGMSFGPNQQIGYIAKVAAERGFDMVVATWRGGMLRAETTKKMKPEWYQKPGEGLNQVKYNQKYSDTKPNNKRRELDRLNVRMSISSAKRIQSINPKMAETIAQAEAMEQQGKTADEIFKATNLAKGINGQWEYELDYDVRFKNGVHIGLIQQTIENTGKPMSKSLPDVISYPALFQVYPELRDVRIIFNISDDDFIAGAAIKEKRIIVNVTEGNTEAVADIAAENGYEGPDMEARGYMAAILHEVQHFIQVADGMPIGANNASFFNDAKQRLYNFYKREADATGDQEFEQLAKQLEEVTEESPESEVKELVKNAADARYFASAGEVQSRNIERRYLNEGLRSQAPENTEDLRRDRQIVDSDTPAESAAQLRVPSKRFKKVSHKGDNYSLSFVSKNDLIDIQSLIKDIANKGQKVWFWTADQLGRGMYYDKTIGKDHYLDAGPSFALDPVNRERGIIWATGKGESWVNRMTSESDYIFIISGSPSKSKLFNKRVAEILFNRIKGKSTFEEFKNRVISSSKVSKINEILNAHDSFESLLQSPDRKQLLVMFEEQKSKKSTPLKSVLEEYGIFINYEELRDGFYKENDFEMNDIMLVLKPTGFGGASDHSTYENNVLGEVVGVPDAKVNAFDIMTQGFKDKYTSEQGASQQSQAVAPYGAGVRGVSLSISTKYGLDEKWGEAAVEDAQKMLHGGMFQLRPNNQTGGYTMFVLGVPSGDYQSIEEAEVARDMIIKDALMKKYPQISELVADNILNNAKRKNVTKPLKKSNAEGLMIPVESRGYTGETRSWRQRAKEAIGKWWLKYFDSSKGLPELLIKLRQTRVGNVDFMVSEAEAIVNDMKKKAEEIGFTDFELLDRALRNYKTYKPFNKNWVNNRPEYKPSVDINEDFASLPVEMQEYVVKMRSVIDGISEQLVRNGLVNPELGLVLESNLGTYVHRSYKMFTMGKKWVKFLESGKGKEILDSAHKELTHLYAASIVAQAPDMTLEEVRIQANELADAEIKRILSARKPFFGMDESSLLPYRNTGSLKRKEDLPKWLRELLGEYEDPATSFLLSIAENGQLLATSQYLADLRDQGLGTILFEEGNRPPEASYRISSQNNAALRPLEGLYATKEVYETLTETSAMDKEGFRLLLQLMNFNKMMKTVGSVPTQAKNFISNVGFALHNGHFDVRKAGEAWSYYRRQVMNNKTTDVINELQPLYVRGVLNQSLTARELQQIFRTNDFEQYVLDSASNWSDNFTDPAKFVRWVSRGAGRIYQASDDFWKIYAFYNERSSMAGVMYGKAYESLTQEEKSAVDDEAAERVMNTYPTYDRIWEAFRRLSLGGMLGNFIAFRAEVFRVSKNSYAYTFRDIKQGIQSGNNRQLAHGLKRLYAITQYNTIRGYVLYQAAKAAGYGVAGLISSVGGDDEEDKKRHALNSFVAEWARSDDKIFNDKKISKDGTFEYYILGSIDPYASLYNIANAFTDGNEYSKEGGAGAAALEIIAPFIEPEMTISTFAQAMTNNDAYGMDIYNIDDTYAEKLFKGGKYVAANTMAPGTVTWLYRMFNRRDEEGKMQTGFYPTELYSLIGARPYTANIGRIWKSMLRESQSGVFADAAFDFKKAAKMGDSYTAEANERWRDRIMVLHRMYTDAIKLGYQVDKLDAAFKDARYEKKLIEAIRTGVPYDAFNAEGKIKAAPESSGKVRNFSSSKVRKFTP
jgi:hypothetical protein